MDSNEEEGQEVQEETVDNNRPLEAKYIRMIEKMKMGKSSKECAVCIKKFKTGCVIFKLPCKHVYHKDCMKPWFDKQSSCPLCRMNLKKYFDGNHDIQREEKNPYL